MQEVDAERRIQILRGLRVDKPPPLYSTTNEQEKHGHSAPRRDGKRRRITGEDDTERDIRCAQEASATTPAKPDLQLQTPKSSDAPLTDTKGHINLFPMEGSSRNNAPKNAEAEAESAKRKKEFEDQYTMRFSNAAGFKQAVGQKPWYYSMGGVGEEDEPSRDVWGNEDPRRKEREKMRIVADDPLATIQKGVVDLREVERERNKWKEEREREMRELVDLEGQRKRKTKRSEEDTLESFSLDAPSGDEHHRHRRDRNKERHSRRRHRGGSHSPGRSKNHSHRHHHRHTSKGGEMSSKEHRERHSHRHHRSNKIKHPSSEDQDQQHHRAHKVSMESLRQERDERERTEHARASTLLARSDADVRPGWEKRSGGRYSAQFAVA